MKWRGTVVSIHSAAKAGEPLQVIDSAEARAGAGLVGDRYGCGAGTYFNMPGPDREITLIETEALEGLQREYEVSITAAQSRRNVATRGVPLNHLIGKQFRIGEVIVQGIRLCEPCGHLEKLTGNFKLREGLKHRGGLRAQILTGGMIHAGDPVEPLEQPAFR
jgi:MOSC domain-containing protein YiiM